MTLRLNDELEDRLEAYCKRTGQTKSAVVAEGLEMRLATPDIARLELTEDVDVGEDAEARYERRRALLDQQYRIEVEIAGWIAENVVWTKKPDPSGKVGPGILGRNTVIGFTDTFWDASDKIADEVYVIAQHHSGRATGIQAHHRYVMPYSTWLKCMRMVPRA